MMRRTLLVMLCAAELGCGSDDEPSAEPDTNVVPEPTFASIRDFLGENCALSACHGGSGTINDLRGNAGLYERLTSPLETSDDCDGFTLVVPGDVEASLLPKMMRPDPPCVAQMPNLCDQDGPRGCLSESQIQPIEAWIAAGAPE